MNTPPTDPTETEVRAALRSYADDVHPAERLGEIRARTRGHSAPSRWRGPWVLAAGAAAVATAVVLGGLALVGSDPAGKPTPVAAGVEREVTVYEIGVVSGHAWLYPVEVTTSDTGDPVLDAVRALREHEPTGDRSTMWGQLCAVGTGLQSVAVRAGVVVVDFAQGSGGSCDVAERQYLEVRAQQLAWTVGSATGSDRPVQLTIDGRPAGAPVPAEPAAVSAVLIDTPANGATVSGPVTVRGTSDTFEANVSWQVLRDGDVVADGSAMGGTLGDRAPFRFAVAVPPGRYTVRAYAESAEDGRLVAEDTKAVTVD